MKKLLLIVALAASALYAQSPDNGDYQITGSLDMTGANWVAPFVPVGSDPSGSCSHNYQIVIDSSGKQFVCLSGTWSGLNTGGLASLTTNTILKAATATTATNSALSDDGSNVTSSEPLIVTVPSSGACSGYSCIILGTSHTPASSSETCTAGTIVWDTSYIYVCTAANTYKRSALTSF